MEKGYRAWGHDLSPDYTPYDSGLGFAVKLSKSADFIGRDALLKEKQTGSVKRLIMLTVQNSEAYALGDEPILRNGQLVGFVSSAAYGHTIGAAVCMGYVKHTTAGTAVTKEWLEAADVNYEIEINGVRYACKASLSPPYDPQSLRVKM